MQVLAQTSRRHRGPRVRQLFAIALAIACLQGCDDDPESTPRAPEPTQTLDQTPQTPGSSGPTCLDASTSPPSGDTVKVYFSCAGEFKKAFVYRPATEADSLNEAVRASVAGPTAEERALGFEGGFDPSTKYEVSRTGNVVTLNLDSNSFNSEVWKDVTGGAAAVRPLEQTLATMNPAWKLSVEIDGKRLCEFGDGVVCPDDRS